MMDTGLTRLLTDLQIPAGEQRKLASEHSITNYPTLKAKQYQLDRKQLANVDSAVQDIVAAALVYLDSLDCRDPLSEWDLTGWILFAATVGGHGVFDSQLSSREGGSSGGNGFGSGASRAGKIVLDSDPPEESKVSGGDVVNGDAMEVDEALEDDVRGQTIGSVRVPRGPRPEVNEEDDGAKSDNEQMEGLTATKGKFDLVEQGFNPKEASLLDIPLDNDKSDEKGSPLEFVVINGRRFQKGKCYYFQDSESEGAKVVVGIRSFRTAEEANCVRIMHISETFLGIGDDGRFAKAIRRHYDNEFVQVRVRRATTVQVSKLGAPCEDPFDLPKLIYEPQAAGSSQAFAYVKDNTVRNVVRVPRKEIRLIEGFSGAGGMHLGYEAEGFTTVTAVEYNEQAVKTFRHNNPGVPVYCGDIRVFLRPQEKGGPGVLEKLGRVDIIHTSSPCQGFSKANRSGGQNDEANNELSYTFTELLQITGALCGVFENVEGMWSQKGMKYLRKILIDCIELGYQIRLKILRSCDYGDPQPRPRLIIIAAKNFVQMPDHPAPTHGRGKKPYVKPKDVMEYLRTPMGRQYPNSDLKRAKAAESTKLQEHRFAPAIKASGCPILHYDEDRCITIREAAALQSFPYDYEFLGTLAEQQRQVGNAVPVEMSRAIARSVRESLRQQYAEEFETTDSSMEEDSPNTPGAELEEEESQPETILEAPVDPLEGRFEDDEVVVEGQEIRGVEEEESKEEAMEMQDGRQKRHFICNMSECKEELD